MKDIEVDEQGRQRCWNCGGLNFTQQRTMRSKVAFGVGALVAKKKLRCVRCGEYNDVGGAKVYRGPASRKYRGEWEAEARSRPAGTPAPPAATAPPPAAAPVHAPESLADELKKLAELRDAGVLNDDEFHAQKGKLLGAAAAVPPPGSPFDELKKLAELRDAGVLNEEELQVQKGRLLGTAPAVPPPASAFDVILVYTGDRKIQIIKVIRDLTSLGLREAKDLVDEVPSVILEQVTEERAALAKSQLERWGATVDLK